MRVERVGDAEEDGGHINKKWRVLRATLCISFEDIRVGHTQTRRDMTDDIERVVRILWMYRGITKLSQMALRVACIL